VGLTGHAVRQSSRACRSPSSSGPLTPTCPQVPDRGSVLAIDPAEQFFDGAGDQALRRKPLAGDCVVGGDRVVVHTERREQHRRNRPGPVTTSHAVEDRGQVLLGAEVGGDPADRGGAELEHVEVLTAHPLGRVGVG